MNIQQQGYALPISDELIQIIQEEVAKSAERVDEGFIMNFRDPDYSPETGGYHPVEISINEQGKFLYITDFAYFGVGYFAELDKEIDFDFHIGLMQHMGCEFPLEQGRELFLIWQDNFCHYYRAGVFQVSITPC